MYYPFSENKGADQKREADLRLCFRICKKPVSHDEADLGPYSYQKALYTGKHFYLPKSIEKTHARSGLYALWITILYVLDNKCIHVARKGMRA